LLFGGFKGNANIMDVSLFYCRAKKGKTDLKII
jgi:hypothetical protein